MSILELMEGCSQMLSKQDKNEIGEIVDQKLDGKLGVFIEHMNDQFARVIEAVQVIVDAKTEAIPRIEKKLDEMNARQAAVEFEQIQTSKVSGNHENRITKLESAK